MVRTITSPGVQIVEKNFSVQTNTNFGTQILVTGFASQGPTVQPLVVTSISEFESIYGLPTNAAERYFYHTCKEVLNSPSTLTTIRLPYGSGSGADFSELYSALLFPMAFGVESVELSGVPVWMIGSPIHITLTENQYNAFLQGNFDWEGTAVNTTTTVTSGVSSIITFVGEASAITGSDIKVHAGFIVLNSLQTVNNDFGEGYYIAFADNSNVYGTSSNFDAITTLKTLTAQNSFGVVAPTRLNFALSATEYESSHGIDSISEQLEKVGFIGFEGDEYRDYLSFAVYRVQKSLTESNILNAVQLERFVGSFDYNRKEFSPTSSILTNAFLEDKINAGSAVIKMLINPQISKQYQWTTPITSIPTTNVRSSIKSSYTIGVYTSEIENNRNKIIGNVPAKLDKVLRFVETPEEYTIDCVTDGGLSTIYAVAEYSKNSLSALNVFDDTVAINSFNVSTSDPLDLVANWRAVANTFVNFAQNTRKDCIAILDPLRHIFVNGRDSKVNAITTSNFTLNIYNPLKVLANSINSSYAAMYGNWIKVRDNTSDRFIWVPFSGYAAAVIARSEFISYPWSAPAGINRGTFLAIDLAFNPNQKQRDRLYDLAVNPVVFFPGDGFVVYGQKTLQSKPSAFDRINVRRLFLVLERATQRALKQFVFELNTEFTRTRIKNTITPLFDLAKSSEGLYEYMIVCDERNNLPEVIDNNEIVVDLYLKPIRTGEFILVNFIATRTGQNFQEVI